MTDIREIETPYVRPETLRLVVEDDILGRTTYRNQTQRQCNRFITNLSAIANPTTDSHFRIRVEVED